MKDLLPFVERLVTGEVFYSEEGDNDWAIPVHNVYFSKCSACKKVAIWVYDQLVFPPEKTRALSAS